MPPEGQTCGQYLREFVATAGGYVADANAMGTCEYCPVRTADAFLVDKFNIFYTQRWRDFNFLWCYIAFNVSRLAGD